MRVSRAVKFTAMHSHHGMLVEPPHSHNYEVILTIDGEPNEEGFICDFRAVKRVFYRVVQIELERVRLDKLFEYPTTENLARWIWGRMEPFFPLYSVEVKEKPHSRALYFGPSPRINKAVQVAIGLGSNVGDRTKWIVDAAIQITEDVLENAKFSSLYESKPWGPIQNQPLFLNAVVTGISEWKPPAIVNYLKNLERDLGRLPRERMGPREIDLDLLCYGEITWEGEGIKVPHPELNRRDFVLMPLCEVWPTWTEPRSGKNPDALLKELLKEHPVCSMKVAPPIHLE